MTTRILGRYLSAIILKHYLLFTLVNVVVASLIEFLENRDGLLDDPAVSVVDALKFSVLSAPGIYSLLAGFIALASVLIAAISLVRYSELKAVLAAGLSYGQMLAALAPAALVMLAFHFTMINVAGPAAAAELREWGIGKAWKGRPGETEALWTRDGSYILSVRHLRGRDQALLEVELFALGRSGALEWHMTAPSAHFTSQGLALPAAIETVTGQSRTVRIRDFILPTNLDFETLSLLASEPRQMPAWNIARVLKLGTAASHPRQVYELWFHKKLAAPVTTALAVFLLAALVQHLHRLGSVRLLLAGLAAGFCYFVADAVLTGLGESGMVQPAAAAWAMTSLLGLVVVVLPMIEQAAWASRR